MFGWNGIINQQIIIYTRTTLNMYTHILYKQRIFIYDESEWNQTNKFDTL